MKVVLIATCLLGLTTVALGENKDASSYQHATIANKSSVTKDCEVQFAGGAFGIRKCSDFQDGQAVEYRIAGDALFIRTDGAKEFKHQIISKTAKSEPAKVIVWLKGTVQGYGTRREYPNNSGNGSSLQLNVGGKKVKVYELHGAEAVYQVDLCGSFQAGKFSPGEEVEYRVDGERLYIRHDGTKEYSCQIEGKRLPDRPADGAK